MENIDIYNFKEQISSITYSLFKNTEVFKNTLLFMNNFPTESWYNVVSIFSNIPNACCVHSLESWAKELNVSKTYASGSSGIPYIYYYQEIDENSMDFIDKEKLTKVFDYSQLDFKYEQFAKFRNISYASIGPLQEFIQSKSNEEILKMFHNKENFWKSFIKDECSKNDFYQTCNEDTKNFIVNSCLFATSTVFDTDYDLNMSKIESIQKDSLKHLFISIHDIIFDLANNIIELHTKMLDEEKAKNFDKILKLRLQRKLSERIRDAKAIAEKAQRKENI